MIIKVLLALGLKTVLLNYYLKFKRKPRIKKEKSNLYLQSLEAVHMTISRITECHFCFSAKGILSGDQSSVLTFTLRGSQTAPGKTVK